MSSTIIDIRVLSSDNNELSGNGLFNSSSWTEIAPNLFRFNGSAVSGINLLIKADANETRLLVDFEASEKGLLTCRSSSLIVIAVLFGS